MGMTVFLISLSALFAATIVGYLIVMIRFSGEQAIHDPFVAGTGERTLAPASLPDLPSVLWLSTAVILASSVTVQFARSGIRRGGRWRLTSGMVLTLGLALAFLVLQTVAWLDWHDRAVGLYDDQQYRFAISAFFVLSGLHAAHVVGGIIPMTVVAVKALANRYTREHHAGVAHLTLYWHFLDVIWLILFAMLAAMTLLQRG